MKVLKKITISLIAISSLHATTVPTIGDAVKQIEIPKEVTQTKIAPLIKIDGIKPTYRPELINDENFEKVLVKQFNIENNIHIDSETLLSLLKSHKGEELSFNDMQIIATIITKAYREAGYIVARAYIPVQKMDDGVLDISIIEGTYGVFKIKNNSTIKTSFIKNTFSSNKEGNVVHNDSLERSLLIVNAIPGIGISSANIQAGKTIGSSDFIITVDKTKSYDGYILGNNYGGRYTGENQLIAGLNLNSPLNIGDKLSLVGFVSDNNDLLSGSATYAFPLFSSGLRAELAYSHTLYSLSKEYKSLNAQGSSESYYAQLNYPLIKKRAVQLDIFVKAKQNALGDEIKSTAFESNKNLNIYSLGLDFNKENLSLFNLKQKLKTSMIIKYGNLEFEDEVQKALDKAGVNMQGDYSKIEFSLNYNIELSKNIIFENSFKYQHTLNDKNLDSSEDFSVGGAYGVKLYPSGELSAENGYLFNTEIKYLLPNIKKYSHKLGFFYDLGKVTMQNPTATFETKTLQDVGIGYYANYKSFFANTQIAWKIDNENITSEPDESFKVLWMGGYSF